jgi:hypothetical protein
MTSPLETNSTNYFNNSDTLSTSLVPEVYGSMIKEAIAKKDSETVKLIIHEGNSLGHLSRKLIENLIADCLQRQDSEYATLLLHACSEKSSTISIQTCHKLMEHQINYCKWFEAVDTAQYMIKRGYSFQDREIFHLLGGLMSDSQGVIRVLELVALIAS